MREIVTFGVVEAMSRVIVNVNLKKSKNELISRFNNETKFDQPDEEMDRRLEFPYKQIFNGRQRCMHVL